MVTATTGVATFVGKSTGKVYSYSIFLSDVTDVNSGFGMTSRSFNGTSSLGSNGLGYY